jgi:hypothetical protein
VLLTIQTNQSGCSSAAAVWLCRTALQVMTFCEIVHHTRKSFSLDQLGGVVSYLACCVADRSLPFNTQSTCVRLSLNLVECLYQVGAMPAAPPVAVAGRTTVLLFKLRPVDTLM